MGGRGDGVKISYTTFFAADVDALAEFYIGGLGLEEIAASRDARYREVIAGPIKLGFAHAGAYAMLDMPGEANPTGLRGILTFDVGARDAIDPAVERAVAAGATLVKPAFETFFGQYQAVLRDPAGNAFRLSAAIAR